jgi:glycosyltransferase involved in cell wall biosynthesis
MISYKNVFEFNKKTGAKVFLYPMDMAPFTGGCHYSWDCNGYTKLCGNCPALNSNNLYDQTYKNLKFKSFYIQQSNISLFAGNSQLTYQIRNSAIFKNKKIYEDIYPIPDENIFYDRNKIDARKYFNLNFNDKILFFGCNSLFDKRKGISILIEALNNSLELIKKNNNIFLLIAGNGYEEIKNLLPFKNKYIGHISDFNELALAYSASDFYISPSVEDAGPTMVLQSILCNTPIISFDIGFAKDLIEDRKNGFKAERKNAESLAKSLKSAFDISQTEYEEIKLNLNLTEKRIKETSFSDKIYKIISES